MRRNFIKLTILTVCASFVLAGCDTLWLDCYWRSERYVLLAIDAKEQMALSFDTNDGGALELVGPTVFSIGTNEKYIVVKQHPETNQFGTSFDSSVTNYFIVERTFSSNFKDRKKGVRGPITEEQFGVLGKSLHLPPFTKTFDDLK